MTALWETILAVWILSNVILAGVGVDLARKLADRFSVLKSLWAVCKRWQPQVCDTAVRFTEIWDSFISSQLEFEERFAVFCDQLGDFLEALVQRAFDLVERMFQIEQTAALCHLAVHQVTRQECKGGVGHLAVKSCAICFEDWQPRDHLRILPVCSHAFHCNCVDAWLYQQGECPLCRTAVVLSYG